MNNACMALLAGFALAGLSTFGATVRLVYGKDWQRAGRDVANTLESPAWKALAKSAYAVELVDEEGKPDKAKNLGSLKLPCVFALDDKGRCFCVIESVPYDITADGLFRQLEAASAARAEIEKRYGTDTADGCGQFLSAMERYVGSPRRVISKGFYADVYEKLGKLDPDDKEGWLRHFTMPFANHDGKARTCANADGLEIVEEATWYRKNGKTAEGETFVSEQLRLPDKHLTTEQKQAIRMARFALYAPDDMDKPWTHARKDEMAALLKGIAEADGRTLWGTAAHGWLASPVFGGTALPTAAVPPKPLRARREIADAGAFTNLFRETAVCQYVREKVGDKTFAEIARREGGMEFLTTFFADAAWLEQFAGSGPADYAAALKALDLMVWNDEKGFVKTSLGRHAATALALNHGGDYVPEKLIGILDCYRDWDADGTLHDSTKELDTYGWRIVVAFGQNTKLPVENLRWAHDFSFVPASRYSDMCWQCAWRRHNCFGASVHGKIYYRPWEHAWCMQEMRYRVGGVCGALSKFGSHCAQAHGLRCFTAGQPEHCAYILWDLGEKRWKVCYSVTGHTDPHFVLGGRGFAALEEQERYYGDPKRMAAERLRWRGEYEASMRLVGGNWQAAKDWLDSLRERKASDAEWEAWAQAVLATFKDAPSSGWQLYFEYLDRFGGNRAAKLAAAKTGLRTFVENKAESAEPMYYDECVLEPLEERFKDDRAALAELLPAALEGQAKSPHFYRSTVAWASARMMNTPEEAKKFIAMIAANAEKTGQTLDYKEMIRKASDLGDFAAYWQVFDLMDRLSPDLKSKPTGKTYPAEDYGGKLVSDKAILRLSSVSPQYNKPTRWREVVVTEDHAEWKGFHTENEKAPWVTLVLPGESEVAGVTVVNTPASQYASRQAPLRVWVSTDGKAFTEVFADDTCRGEWRCALKVPAKAKYVRVGRPEDQSRKDPYHLHKVLVYGKKLY